MMESRKNNRQKQNDRCQSNGILASSLFLNWAGEKGL